MRIHPLHNNTFRCFILFSFLLVTGSCRKEGLPGPKGPQGPPGRNGTGGGGGNTRVITYEYQSKTFAWEETGQIGDSRRFRLAYSTPSHVGYTFTLPDSVTRYIEEGSLLIYMLKQDTNEEMTWSPVSHMPVEFTSQSYFYYTKEKTSSGAYRFTMQSEGMYRPDLYDPVALRFVVIPKTASGELLIN